MSSNGTSTHAQTLPIPAPAAPWTALLSVPRSGRRWPGVVRAAVTVALPGLLGLACGAGSAAAVATLGAFAVVYGEGKPYRVRWWTVAFVGAALVALAGTGATVGSTVHRALDAGGSGWWPMLLVLVMTVVVAVAAFVVDALRLGAPGSFLLLLSVVISSTLPTAGIPVPSVVAWTAIGAVWALVVAMSGVVLRPRTAERAQVAAALAAVDAVLEQNSPAHRREAVRSLHSAWQCLHDARLVESDHPLTRTLRAAHVRCAAVLHGVPHESAASEDDLRAQIPLRRPSIRHRLALAAHPRGRTATVVARLVVACLVAGSTAVLFGVGRPDWAVITTAMILHQGPDRVLGTYRAVHRFVGTLLGLVLLVALSLLDLHGVLLIVVLAMLMAGIEAFLVRHYGLAIAALTPLAMILGGAGDPGDIAVVSRDRFLETVIGVSVALVVMWGVLPRAHRRILVDADRQVADTIARITAPDAGDEGRAELRRDLEFDLHASTTAAVTAAHTDREWTTRRWEEHRSLHECGYRVLTSPTTG
ncbi:FUSC family protein [Rhodococcus sp. NPDC003318]|uniref:FUSC family protein n=1 Tax=Rhodococcus sp. NPDC003318 TaxID=3364503 RepID=UPI0036B9AC9C